MKIKEVGKMPDSVCFLEGWKALHTLIKLITTQKAYKNAKETF